MTIKEKWVSWEELNDLIAGVGLLPSYYPYGSIGGLTTGSIPFAGATGFLTEDNATLFWDETNARLGLNQVVPTARIDIVAEAAFPGINISAGAVGEMSTPDGEVFRWGHWNEVDTFTERLKFDAAGLFYISYLSASSVVFAGANGEIKQDNINLRWDDANNRLGVGCTPAVVLDVVGAGETEGGTSYGGVVARFRTTDDKHVSVSIEANTGKDPVLSFAENVVCIWDLRNDASATDEFQLRYQVGEVNLTYFSITNAGDVQIPLGYLALMNGEELRFYDVGSSNYVGFEAPALGADQIWVLPNADGGAGSAIITDAGGNLSFTGSPVLLDSDFGSAGFMMTDGAGTYSILPGGENVVDHNIYIGTGAGTSLVGGGQYHILIGESAGASLTTADKVICMGYQSGQYGDLEYDNVYIGYRAGRGGGAGQGGSLNVAIGSFALQDVNAGNYNVAIGTYALQNITSGSHNFGLGYNAFGSMTIGANNVGIGSSVGLYYTHSDSVLIGTSAGIRSIDAKLVAIGKEAGRGSNAGGCNASNSVFIGYRAGYAINCTSTILYNVGIGTYALTALTSGDNNVAIGEAAGNTITSGSGNVCIGYYAGSTRITNQSNLLYIANTNTATPLIYGEFPNALLRVQATNFNVIGTCNLGDGGVTNYAEIKTDGEVNLHGTARVINGQWIDAQAIKAPTTNPAELISFGILETPAFQFADAIEANQENVTFNMRLPYRMDKGVAPFLFLGWSAEGISPGDCRWQLEYLYTKLNDNTALGAQDTVLVTSTASATTNGMVTAQFPAMELPEATDICVHCRVTRLSADGADTIADTVELHGLCLSFTTDRLGLAT